MARNKSEKICIPDPRIIVHPNMGEHRLRVDEKKRGSGESYWQVSVINAAYPDDCFLATQDADDLESAIKVYCEVPNRFWFETDKDWVGHVPPEYDPDINPEAAA